MKAVASLAIGTLFCVLLPGNRSPGKEPIFTKKLQPGRDYWNFSRTVFTNGDCVVSIGEPGTVTERDVVSGKLMRVLKPDDPLIYDIGVSPDAKRVATVHRGCVKIWDFETGKRISEIRLDRGNDVIAVAFSPSGRYVACPGQGPMVHIWELASGNRVLSLRRKLAIEDPHRDGICTLAFSPDGRRLAVADQTSRAVTVWDAVDGQTMHSLEVKDSGGVWDGIAECDVAYSRDGKCIVTKGDVWDSVRIWQADNGKLLHKFKGGVAMALSPDSRFIATVAAPETEWTNGVIRTRSGELIVWDCASEKPLWRVNVDACNVRCWLAFSSDGKRLALVNEEYTLKVWDLSAIRSAAQSPKEPRHSGKRLKDSGELSFSLIEGPQTAIMHLMPPFARDFPTTEVDDGRPS